jgi:hypothetical protein
MSAQITPRVILMKQIELGLGAQMVDVELDIEHLNLAITIGVQKLRQQSDGANLEKDIFLHITAGITEYTLPEEVQEVRRLYRRGIGGFGSGGGVNFDPVDAAVYNIFMLQPNRTGGLATWDFYNQHLETAERLFASQYNFTWDTNNKKLTIIRRPRADEEVVVRVYVKKSEDDIINDPYTGPWLRSYSTAQAKYILGEARGKFPSGFPGPNGAVMLNGDALKQEASAEIEKLEKQLLNLVTSGDGYAFVVG